jgi:4-hydroxy-tetrahydrodipicolinate synthase
VVERLSKHPNIMGIKEASGDMSYVMNIARYVNEDFVMYSGNDDITVPLLAMGGSGVISVWANLMPETVHNMVEDYLEGRRDEAVSAQLRYLDLINALFMEVNPIPIKAAMDLIGLEVESYRLPLCAMDPSNKAKLASIMSQAGLVIKE